MRFDRFRTRAGRVFNREAAGGDDAQTFDGDFDAAIQREALRVTSLRKRLIGTAAFDRDPGGIDAAGARPDTLRPTSARARDRA